jgi:hypothetical protein
MGMYAMLHLASIFGGTSAYGGISWWNADSSAGCLLSVKNCIYYELKESIFIKVDDLFLYRKESAGTCNRYFSNRSRVESLQNLHKLWAY